MRRGTIERDQPDLSIGQQCALLQVPRSSFYYAPQGEKEHNLNLMRLIDVQFLETPFFGVGQMTWHLRNDGHTADVPFADLPETEHPVARQHMPACVGGKPTKGHKSYP